MKIVELNSTSGLPEGLIKKLSEVGEYHSVRKPGMSEEEALRHTIDAEIMILAPSAIKPVKETFIKRLKKVKHIALVTVGYEWVDVEACKKLGIPVSTPVGANSEAVAEHTVGLMIDLAKRITEFDRDIRNKGAFDFRNYTGTELYQKTLGIIGLGNIGHKVARIAKGFDMKILAFDRSEESTKEYKVVGLEELCKKSDYIAVCIPLTNETENLISDEEIRLMKQGAILVNTAREPIVNKQAALKAVQDERLGGYGVDVGIMQKIQEGDEYLKYPNVIVLPHNAFNTKETVERVNNLVVDNILSFVKGDPKNIL